MDNSNSNIDDDFDHLFEKKEEKTNYLQSDK